jgi:wyosine [tRNA(Phe)-imidazoG37] synthetase (radical SAM superfamily)
MKTHPLHQQHDRHFAQNRFVYPVLSRRSGGISVGINLNPDKVCNFDCIYCQVERISQSETRFVETSQLLEELDQMLSIVSSGELFTDSHFSSTPPLLRRLNDIAFSGDGEPTTYRNFDSLIESCCEIKRRHGLDDVKMVLITNASMFHRPHVQRGLEILDANRGEIWAKLEAGTEEYYQRVERTSIPFQQVLDNILLAAQRRPIVIQALFMKIDGESPEAAEQQAFCDRLRDIIDQGGQVSLVQIYTVARPPAESMVTPLENMEVDRLVELVRQQTGLAVNGFYGSLAGTKEAGQ